METLKSNILANLDYLPNKVNFKKECTQVVYLCSKYYHEETRTSYTLTLEVIVIMKPSNTGPMIKTFEIEEVLFFKNEDEVPKFQFSRSELDDYIDF